MAIKAMKSAPRERSSQQNGLPEPVPYVYRAQRRRNTYAARIAQRNAEKLPQSPVLAAGADEAVGVAARSWRRRGDLGGLDLLGAEYGVKGSGQPASPEVTPQA